MRRFFSKEETRALNKGRSGLSSCYACGLYAKCNSPKLEPYGKFKKGIMIIGEAPNAEEDRSGKLWKGKDGEFLRSTLLSLGVDVYRDCVSLNAINCKPPDSRKISPKAIDCCRDVKVLSAIEKYKPYVIILLGPTALKSFLAHRWFEGLGAIERWRGWTIPDKEFKTWACPTHHPSHILKMDSRVAQLIWKQDIEKAISMLEVAFPRYKKIRFRKLKSLQPLKEITSGTIAFDFETTGLKPQPKNQRIVCCSIAYTPNDVFVFPMPKNKKNWKPLIDLLQNPNVGKVASNMKFEDNWCNVKLGTKVVNWEWDTMQSAHVMDNRKGISGLKFQAYVRLGVLDYSSAISPYLRAADSNSLNKVEDLITRPGGMNDLLKYCGYDSIYELRIALLQQSELQYNWLPF